MILAFSGAALLILGSSATAYHALADPIGFSSRLLRGYEQWLTKRTSFLLLDRSGAELARVQIVLNLVCVVLLLGTGNSIFGVAAIVVTLGPALVLWRQSVVRIAKLEAQLETWLLMLANALKATSSAGEAIASTATLVARPFSEEVDLLVKELRLGVSLDRALDAMGKRVGSMSISGALMVIRVARRTGGDLSATLERVSGALREAARLEGVLRTKTAEGRGQVLVLALVPFLLCFLITWLDQAWFEPMLYQAQGRVILGACVLAWTIAVLWAHQIVRTPR